MSQRLQKVNELIKQILNEAMLREIEFPANSLITITRVETTPDIKSSKVSISVIPENFRGTALAILRKKSAIFHQFLKKRLVTKFTPNLKFAIDDQEVFANEVEKILDDLQKK